MKTHDSAVYRYCCIHSAPRSHLAFIYGQNIVFGHGFFVIQSFFVLQIHNLLTDISQNRSMI